MVAAGTCRLYSNGRFRPADLELPPSDGPRHLLPGPGGSVLAVLCWEQGASSSAGAAAGFCVEGGAAADGSQSGQWVLHAYSLELEAGKPLLSSIQDPVPLGPYLPGVSSAAAFSLAAVGDQTQLVAWDCVQSQSASARTASSAVQYQAVLVQVTNFSQSNILRDQSQRSGSSSSSNSSPSAANAMLDYLHTSFEKFPAVTGLGYAPSPTRLVVLVDQPSSAQDNSSSSSSSTTICSRVNDYICRVWENVQKKTRKPFEGFIFTHDVRVGWQVPSEIVASRVSVGLGAWLESAMMLVPLQICRCEGNTLWPMSDGVPLCLSEEDTNVNQVAKKISFGVYDLVFAAASASHGASASDASAQMQLPVITISSMGSQSIGKSFQQNHLVGSFFDVSGRWIKFAL